MDTPITTHFKNNPTFVLMRTLLALLALVSTTASATTIYWGNANGDTLLTSSGAALDDSFSFELGTFGSFVPSEGNIQQWGANWKVFDRADTAGGGWTSGASYFTSQATLKTDKTTTSTSGTTGVQFEAGEQAYIWVFNSKSAVPGGEWALVTGSSVGSPSPTTWKMPAPADQTGASLSWRIDDASSIILGGLNSDRGPGQYTSSPTAYQLQTSAIPEPGSSLLIASVGFGLMLRRRQFRGAR